MTNFSCLLAALAALTLTCASTSRPPSPRPLTPSCGEVCVDDARTAFADCVTQRGFVLYGASWCHSCHEQLKLFGAPAWQHINYVDCSPQFYDLTPQCEELKFAIYPTWILPDGRRLEGLLPLTAIAKLSGCALPP